MAAVAAVEEEAGAAAVAFLVVGAVAFRGAAAAAFRDPVEEIFPGEVRAALLVRGTFPAATEAVVWLIPGMQDRATELPLEELPLDND
ncbi:MAG: hypothetical protein JO025_02950 [Verrucomicrobia bacterium]|nr:hypothetical protein [Verrucomicrobiota bacterium]